MNRIKALREAAGLTMKDAAAAMRLPYTTYVNYEKGTREPDSEKLILLADYFDVSIDYLLCRSDEPHGVDTSSALYARYLSETGADLSRYQPAVPAVNLQPMPNLQRVPRLGTIACGEPILAEQNITSYDEIPSFVSADFTLVCKGDSMIGARIHDGDIVCIKQQATVENGQIAAVLIDDEATLKRVRFTDGGVVLWPENPNYAPIVYTGEDAARVRIIGLATHFISNIA